MRYLNVPEVLTIYAEIVSASRVERADIQNVNGLESALAQPQQTFDGSDLYPSIEEKAAALLYSLCQNHPFTDGNKRCAFIATRTFLRLNGFDIDSSDDYVVAEFMYAVARGEIPTSKIAEWVKERLHKRAESN